jgi:hypothetical protein
MTADYNKDYYQISGLDKNASVEAIKSLPIQCHRDSLNVPEDIIKLIDKFHLFSRSEDDFEKNFIYLDKILQKYSSNITHIERSNIAKKIIEDVVLNDDNSIDYINLILIRGNSDSYISLIKFVFEQKPELIDVNSESFQDALFASVSKKIAAQFLMQSLSGDELRSNLKLTDNLLIEALRYPGSFDAYKEIFTKLKSDDVEFIKHVSNVIKESCDIFVKNVEEAILASWSAQDYYLSNRYGLGEAPLNSICIESCRSDIIEMFGLINPEQN